MTDASVVRLRIGRARPLAVRGRLRGLLVTSMARRSAVPAQGSCDLAPADFSPGDTAMKYTLLKEFLADLLRSRTLGRHFRRLATLDSVAETTVSREVPPTLAQTLTRGASSDVPELLARLNSRPDGLSETEAQDLRARHGLNE